MIDLEVLIDKAGVLPEKQKLMHRSFQIKKMTSID